MSILLAILINFGISGKKFRNYGDQGWWMEPVPYFAIPVFLIASGFCISSFLIQDYILPYANVRQDNLRNVIKGRPPQTSSRLQRKWIFGESDRIYNYEYFDGNQDSFVDLNVYDIDLTSVKSAGVTPPGLVSTMTAYGCWKMDGSVIIGPLNPASRG